MAADDHQEQLYFFFNHGSHKQVALQNLADPIQISIANFEK